jgi:hypothetical protein
MYPLIPKSTAYMKPGQFWGFQLSDDSWACGMVLGLRAGLKGRNRRLFLARLLDWRGVEPPDPRSIGARPVLVKGYAHIDTIIQNGGSIAGEIPLGANSGDLPRDDSLPTWGSRVIRIHAEKHLAKKGPNQSPQRNAGSRPPSGDSPVSESPSSLGPRG